MSFACLSLSSPLRKPPINTDWKFISNIKEFPLFTFNFHLYFYVYHRNIKERHANKAALTLFFLVSSSCNCSFLSIQWTVKQFMYVYVCHWFLLILALSPSLFPTLFGIVKCWFSNEEFWQQFYSTIPCLNAVSRLSLSLLSTVVGFLLLGLFFAFIWT